MKKVSKQKQRFQVKKAQEIAKKKKHRTVDSTKKLHDLIKVIDQNKEGSQTPGEELLNNNSKLSNVKEKLSLKMLKGINRQIKGMKSNQIQLDNLKMYNKYLKSEKITKILEEEKLLKLEDIEEVGDLSIGLQDAEEVGEPSVQVLEDIHGLQIKK